MSKFLFFLLYHCIEGSVHLVTDERLTKQANYSSAEEDAFNVYIPPCQEQESRPWVDDIISWDGI